MAVNKLGRTTGLTRGVVTAFELDDIEVDYDGRSRWFDDVIEIQSITRAPFSDGGDSGSLIVDDDVAAVGLLFAGSENGGTNGGGLTYANRIRAVLDDLDVELPS